MTPLSQPEAGRQQRQQSEISPLVDVGSLSVAGSSPHGNSLIRLDFSFKLNTRNTQCSWQATQCESL